MNRRHFLQLLASVPAAAVLAPRILEAQAFAGVDWGARPSTCRIICISTPTHMESRWIRDAFVNRMINPPLVWNRDGAPRPARSTLTMEEVAAGLTLRELNTTLPEYFVFDESVQVDEHLWEQLAALPRR